MNLIGDTVQKFRDRRDENTEYLLRFLQQPKVNAAIRNHVKKTFDVPTLLRFKTTMSASSVEMLQGRELEIPVPWGKITGRINC